MGYNQYIQTGSTCDGISGIFPAAQCLGHKQGASGPVSGEAASPCGSDQLARGGTRAAQGVHAWAGRGSGPEGESLSYGTAWTAIIRPFA